MAGRRDTPSTIDAQVPQPAEHPHPGLRAIVIGQAAEFGYSGTQAVRALREEGCRMILVNGNPAPIMTDAPTWRPASYA